VDVRVLAGERHHLLRPRVADVAGDDHQVREIERHVVEVGDRAAGLRRAQGAGVADLRAERDAQLDTLRVERVVAAVVRRPAPEPRHHAQALEPELGDAAAQLPHRADRVAQVDRREPAEPVGVLRDPRGDLVVGDQRPVRRVPGADQAVVDAARVHRDQRRGQRDRLGGDLHAGPAPQRLQHVVGQEADGRMLQPGVDDHWSDTLEHRSTRVVA
jgi:hypothetical protein